MTADFLRASLASDRGAAETILGASLPSDWPDCRDVLELRLGQLEADADLSPWLLRAMVLKDQRITVGHIGFHTAPDPAYLRPHSPGAVEFGFTVFTPFQRQGYAREASVALMDWARGTHGVQQFVLSIRPDNIPSQSLAAQLGFLRIGSHIDEVDGLEDILERRFDSAPS